MKLISLFLILFSGFVCAHETQTHYDRIHLNATASGRVENDTAIATLFSEAEGSKPALLANKVNENIQWALAKLKKHKDIKAQTSAYNTHPVYRDNKIRGWRVRQTIRLETENMTKLSELLGDLQEKLALQGMQFAVSPARKNKTDDELITEAIAAFETRAKRVAGQLRRKNYKIVDLNISTSGAPVMRHHIEMQAMSVSKMDSPAVSAGEQTVQVTVAGSIELQ